MMKSTIAEIDEKISELQDLKTRLMKFGIGSVEGSIVFGGPKRKISDEARQRMARAQQDRWEKIRRDKTQQQAAAAKKTVTKKTVTKKKANKPKAAAKKVVAPVVVEEQSE